MLRRTGIKPLVRLGFSSRFAVRLAVVQTFSVSSVQARFLTRRRGRLSGSENQE